RILAVLDDPVPAGHARWNGPLIAARLGDVDVQHVWRFLREHKDLLGVREEVQRLFEGAKKKNVSPYSEYIVGLHSGEDGLTPVITLYSEQKLEVDDRPDGTGFIQIPWDQRLTAIDGETQLAARHEAANIEPATKQEFVPIYVCHGKDQMWARQSFHDLNALGVKPNAALSIGMDARDRITQVTREVERQVPFFRNRVNKVRRQLRATDEEVTTIASLRGACVTLAKGIMGVQFGARPVQIDEKDVPSVQAAAVDWFSALADALGPMLLDRENNVVAAPSILAALGAVGHQVLHITDPEARRLKCRELAEGLKAVNWMRGKSWEGIAGKFTPKGTFSLGGPKETAHAIFAALTNPSSEGYARVRGLPSASPSLPLDGTFDDTLTARVG
ncbi:MAG: putative sulfur modification protein DndB, partial [Rhodospirillales bacterium]|nr:putative sulfur modification protein DndB [Rhodospirillales bacterium]